MRKKLEFQADRIEMVLQMHKVSARVTGGTVTPRWVRFQVLPAMGAKISKIKRLSEELAAALDAPNCRISRRGAAVDIEVPRDDPQPVRLLPLYRQLDRGDIPPVTAILGLAEDGAPLLIRLPSPDVAHILVAGTTGSGKTILLKSAILSLAMTNAPGLASPGSVETSQGARAISMVLIDPKGSNFATFADLPHLARPVIQDVEEATEALQSLVRLMERRGEGELHSLVAEGVVPKSPNATRGHYGTPPSPSLRASSSTLVPSVILVIDELTDLLMTGGKEVQTPLTRLLQRGRGAGIHVVAATQKPTSAVLGPLIKANFPVRLVGRVTSATDARVASGWSGTGAERLQGQGDFVAVAEGRVMRFQAAYIAPDEIQGIVSQLASQQPRYRIDLGRSRASSQSGPTPQGAPSRSGPTPRGAEPRSGLTPQGEIRGELLPGPVGQWTELFSG